MIPYEMTRVENLQQMNLCDGIEPPTVSIGESANRLGVCTATIHNWVKTHYLEPAGKGRITLASLQQFQSGAAGREKLRQRANKSQKDTHDHTAAVSEFLQRIALSNGSVDQTGAEYESALSDSYRNREGIYYTPDEVVCDLFAAPQNDLHDALFCDPCCGSGNFIVRAIELGFAPENIYGYDTDPVAVAITKARIRKLTGYTSGNIRVANFLDMTNTRDTPQFDFIYTNPPWGKKLPKKARASIGLRLGAGASTDTCSLFFFACLRHLADDGRLGLLLPEAFFNIAVFEDARIKSLQLAIERLIDYGRVFKGLVSRARGIVIRNQPADRHAGISCERTGVGWRRSKNSFSINPKSILNLHCREEAAAVLQHLLAVPFITLKKQASWGLGIVTGNNRKRVKLSPESGYIPVYRGADIAPEKLQEASRFIAPDMSLYQQVAPLELYEAREKLIYKFISSRLCFFYDDRQRYILNSANLLIPDRAFPVSTKVLGQLLSSDFMNWVFSCIFNTHKILRGDLESLPIHSQFLGGMSRFDEAAYLEQLQIKRDNGTYRTI